MRDLLEHRSALAGAFRRCLPAGIQVTEHGGRFDLPQLERYSKSAPCVVVAVLAGSSLDERPSGHLQLECAAYVVTKRMAAGTADEMGLRLASMALAIAHGRGYQDGPAWDEDAQRPQAISFRNLLSADASEQGIWLGAITWKQLVELAIPANAGELADFVQLWADWNLAPLAAPYPPADAADRIELTPA